MSCVLRLLFVSSILAYASWQDVRTREIDERAWAIMGGFGVLATAYDSYAAWDIFMFLKMLAVVTGVGLAMLLFYKIGFFGFADVEAMVALSTVYPLRTGFLVPFPASVFDNALIITACLPLLIFAYNVFSRPALHEIQDHWYKKIILLFIGYKMPLSRLDGKRFPLVWDGKIRLLVPIEYDSSGYVRRAKEEGIKEVWVTPGVPFVLSITAGFFLAYFWGDLIFRLLFFLFG